MLLVSAVAPRRVSCRTDRRFLVAAFAVGASFGSLAFGIPLVVLATSGSSTRIGWLLAMMTAGMACGSLLGGRVVSRFGADDTLALGLVIDLIGLSTLYLAGSTLAVALGSAACGLGMGLFWVSSQSRLGSDEAGGGPSGFVRHYAAYTAGSALGGPGAGLVVQLAGSGGIETPDQIRLGFLVGVVVLVIAVVVWPPNQVTSHQAMPSGGVETPVATMSSRVMTVVRHGLSRQLADLAMVAAFNFLLTVQPVLLRRHFGLSAATIGAVAGLTAVAKVVGGILARRVVARFGEGRALPGLLVVAAIMMTVAPFAGSSTAYVASSLLALATGLGLWPVLVGLAVERTAPESRPAMLGAWNAREYAAITVASVCSGWLLAVVGPRPVLVISGLLLLTAAAAAHAMFDEDRTTRMNGSRSALDLA